MLSSMTGFGSGTQVHDDLQITVEVKSVNNRFLDINCKLPTLFLGLESQINALLREKLKRGRIEVFVQRKTVRGFAQNVRVNAALVNSCMESFKELAALGVSQRCLDVVLADVIGRREILELTAEDESVVDEVPLVMEALRQACIELVSMRQREGAALEEELRRLLQSLEEIIGEIQRLAASTPEAIQQRLHERISSLLQGIELDQQRLHQEVVYLADRADITEELARLRSHVVQFHDVLEAGEGGRKLEFLLQEFGREVNTCGSKSQDTAITRNVVEAKTILEKMREQVLNVE